MQIYGMGSALEAGVGATWALICAYLCNQRIFLIITSFYSVGQQMWRRARSCRCGTLTKEGLNLCEECRAAMTEQNDR